MKEGNVARQVAIYKAKLEEQEKQQKAHQEEF
jgi:hypothetical protein